MITYSMFLLPKTVPYLKVFLENTYMRTHLDVGLNERKKT